MRRWILTLCALAMILSAVATPAAGRLHLNEFNSGLNPKDPAPYGWNFLMNGQPESISILFSLSGRKEYW